MINSYYFDNDDLDSLLEESGVSLTKKEKGIILQIQHYLREEYNLPLRGYLGEVDMECSDLKTAVKDLDEADMTDFVDASLDEFYFRHQRAYASLVAAQKKVQNPI
jgi:hypothetical protein